MIQKLICIFLLILSLSVYASSEHNLSQSLARSRKLQIRELSYDIHLVFSGTSAFEGKVKINLALNKISEPLLLDSSSRVLGVRINGKEIKEYVHEGGLLKIPASALSQKMVLEVAFSSQLYGPLAPWYVDPQDGKTYFYTDLEPYGLGFLFPCFDQPDLKATFQLDVKVPKTWTFISNELPGPTKISGEMKEVTFPKTPLMSTYLFFIGGGHYHELSDDYNGLPLKIYVRDSLKDKIDAEAIFDLTKKGLAFFESYFGYPYPYSKFGYVFAPDYGASGMENPGAITINEKYIFSEKVPLSYHYSREVLILHEMAHIWFGDLVTMKWWDDLWLNESFATFMSHLAQEKIFNDPSRWLMFEPMRIWSRRTDEKRSTHPIVGEVPDILTAESSFDGITYGKGAAFLKQFYFYAGEETFRKGLQSYFKKFAFKNTELKDFVEAIDASSSRNLKEWTEKWLKTQGLNRIVADFSCEEGKLKRFEVLQTSQVPGNSTHHKTIFGLYDLVNGKLELMKKYPLEYSAPRTNFPQLVGVKCPAFVLPNQDGYGYGVFMVDKKSRAHFKKAISELPDSFGRLQLWITLEQELKDGTISPVEFFDVVTEVFSKETNPIILGVVLGIQNSPSNLIKMPYFYHLTREERKRVSLKLENVLYDRFQKATEFSDLKLELFKLYLLTASSPLSQERLHRFLEKGDNIKGLQITQELRWEMIENLAYNNHPRAMELIRKERKNDPTFEGQVMKNSSVASLPSMDLKKDLWQNLLHAKNLPYLVLSRSAERFHHPDRTEANQSILKEYFSALEGLDWDKNKSLTYYYFEKLFPFTYCSDIVLRMSESSMLKAKLNSYARRRWSDSNEKLSECIRIRNKALRSVVRQNI